MCGLQVSSLCRRCTRTWWRCQWTMPSTNYGLSNLFPQTASQQHISSNLKHLQGSVKWTGGGGGGVLGEATVEPLLADTLNSGQPLNKGQRTSCISTSHCDSSFVTSEKRTIPLTGDNGPVPNLSLVERLRCIRDNGPIPKLVPCREAPLYYSELPLYSSHPWDQSKCPDDWGGQ